MKQQAEKEQWIREWLKKECTANACNTAFHEAYFQKFGGKRNETYWGAQMVYEVQRLMAKMAKEGKLLRFPIGLGTNWQPGFPKWVWGYFLPGRLSP